jgi:hypothetical protein
MPQVLHASGQPCIIGSKCPTCIGAAIPVMAWIKWLHYWYLCMLIHLLMHSSLIMFAYVSTCLRISVSAYGSLCLLMIFMHAYVCLIIYLWVMMLVKENSVGTMQYGGKGSG